VDWSNLEADYERLGSYAAVAGEYGVSKGYVAQQAKKQGINPKPEGRSLGIDWSKLPALYDGGMTFEQLAEHYGCSLHAIQNAMKRLGVKSRPNGLPKGYEWTEERRAAHRAATSDNPEWRAKMRENFLRRLPLMNGPSANSPLEKFLQAALMKAGIGFSTQRVLRGLYCVDILIQQAPVVIEADGSRHNMEPRKSMDAERDADLAAVGYRVFRFNGRQINCDAEGCIARVVAECSLTPDTEPVYDIRTGMRGSDNPKWNGGSQKFKCEYCGAEVTKDAYESRSRKRKFCNSQCYGFWMSKHPEASNRLLDIDWSGLQVLYEGGQTMRQLAAHYGCGVNAVRGAMQRLGIRSRAAGRRPKAVSPDPQ
jgi:very-short-patch-repair endonuclease